MKNILNVHNDGILFTLSNLWNVFIWRVLFLCRLWHALFVLVYHCDVITWASCQIRKIAGCTCTGCAGNVFPRGWLQRELLVSDPNMHHGTCVTHVPWCMSGSLNCGGRENIPGILGACATRNITYLARGPWWPTLQGRLGGPEAGNFDS